MRERVGRANVHRGKRRTQDSQQEPQIRAFVGSRAGDGRGPRELSPLHPLAPPPLHPRIFSVGPVGPLLQRRQGLRRPQAPGSRDQRLRLRGVVGLPTPPQQQPRHGGRTPRRTLRPRPPGREASHHLLLKRREEPLLPLHF